VLLARLIEMLLTRLIEALLALLGRPLLALIRCGVHAGATTIRLGTGLVAVAVHGRPGLVAAEGVRTIAIGHRMLNTSVASD
jgi:hypothetical protein